VAGEPATAKVLGLADRYHGQAVTLLGRPRRASLGQRARELRDERLDAVVNEVPDVGWGDGDDVLRLVQRSHSEQTTHEETVRAFGIVLKGSRGHRTVAVGVVREPVDADKVAVESGEPLACPCLDQCDGVTHNVVIEVLGVGGTTGTPLLLGSWDRCTGERARERR
jgi:hypothetical protein